MMPKPSAEWQARTVGFWDVELQNVGDAAANDVLVSPIDRSRVAAAEYLGLEASHMVETAEILNPTELLRFSGYRFSGEHDAKSTVRFRVEWAEGGSPTRKQQIVECVTATALPPQVAQMAVVHCPAACTAGVLMSFPMESDTFQLHCSGTPAHSTGSDR